MLNRTPQSPKIWLEISTCNYPWNWLNNPQTGATHFSIFTVFQSGILLLTTLGSSVQLLRQGKISSFHSIFSTFFFGVNLIFNWEEYDWDKNISIKVQEGLKKSIVTFIRWHVLKFKKYLKVKTAIFTFLHLFVSSFLSSSKSSQGKPCWLY